MMSRPSVLAGILDSKNPAYTTQLYSILPFITLSLIEVLVDPDLVCNSIGLQLGTRLIDPEQLASAESQLVDAPTRPHPFVPFGHVLLKFWFYKNVNQVSKSQTD